MIWKNFLLQVLFDKVKADRMGSHPDWTDFLQSADWAENAATKEPESSKDDSLKFRSSADRTENKEAKMRDARKDDSSESLPSADESDIDAAKAPESIQDDSPIETYKMAGTQRRRVPSKHIISLAEFDDIKNLVSTRRGISGSRWESTNRQLLESWTETNIVQSRFSLHELVINKL